MAQAFTVRRRWLRRYWSHHAPHDRAAL